MSPDSANDDQAQPEPSPPADEWQPEQPADIGDYTFVEVKEGWPAQDWPPVDDKR